MSIANYVHPQSTLKQFLTNVSSPATAILNPLVIGPQYRLSRFGKETVPAYTYAAASGDQVIPWQYSNAAGVTTNLPGTEIPDLTYTRLFGNGLEASLATILTGDSEYFQVLDASNTQTLKMTAADVSGGTLCAKLKNRPVAVGDIAYVTSAYGTIKRTVTGLLGETAAATFGVNTPDNDDGYMSGSTYNPATAAASHYTCLTAPGSQDVGIEDIGVALTVTNPDDFQGTLQGALLNGAYGETFTLTVTTGGNNTTAVVTVTSASGRYGGTRTSTSANAGFHTFDNTSGSSNIMAGLIVKLDHTETTSSLTLGGVYTFTVTSQYTRVSTATAPVTGTYTGTADTTYLIEVTTGTYNSGAPVATSAVVRISDTAGLDAPASVTLTDNTLFDLGTSGLQMKFDLSLGVSPQGGMRVGDVYYVNCVAEAPSTTVFDKMVLDGPAVDATVFTNYDTHVEVKFRLPVTGEILSTAAADDVAWVADLEHGVTIDSGLSHYLSTRSAGYEWVPFVAAVGTLSVWQRSLQPPAYGEGRIAIASTDDITTLLGTVDVDNDLAMGANEMLNGTLGAVSGYILRTGGTTLSDYNTALAKIQTTKLVYAIAPMTRDVTIQQAVATHCTTTSGPTKKRFRRCYVGTDSPGSYVALRTGTSGNVTATVSAYNGGGNLLVTTATAGVDFTLLGLASGDIVKLIVAGTSYLVDSVISATELVLQSGPGSPVGAAVVIEIWYADTPTSQARYVRNHSKLIGNRRAVNVWTENGTANGVIIPNRYAAAHIAGLRCAMLPQQGLTRTEISTFDSAPAMSLRYDDDTLDAVAADGTMIITQDAESGAIYIRHQLTTDSANGALAYEDSIGVVADYLSFRIDAIVDAYIGKRNVTNATLVDLRNALQDELNANTQSDYGVQAGPLLVSFNSLKITPNPIIKDRVKITFTAVVALPFNIAETIINFDQDRTLTTVIVA